MKRFIYLVIAIIIILFVFEDKVKPYTDPVVEKAKFVWASYLADPFKIVKNFVSEKIADWQEKQTTEKEEEKEENLN